MRRKTNKRQNPNERSSDMNFKLKFMYLVKKKNYCCCLKYKSHNITEHLLFIHTNTSMSGKKNLSD